MSEYLQMRGKPCASQPYSIMGMPVFRCDMGPAPTPLGEGGICATGVPGLGWAAQWEPTKARAHKAMVTNSAIEAQLDINKIPSLLAHNTGASNTHDVYKNGERNVCEANRTR